MKTYNTQALAVIIFANILFQSELKAQEYASTEVHANVGICIGCGITNASYSVDGNTTTYATMNVLAGVLGTYVYQNLSFTTGGNSGDNLNLVIEDPSGGILDINLLGGFSIRTFNNGVSNNDIWNSTNITLGLLNGSTTKYVLSIPLSYSVDQIQIRLNAGLVGTLGLLRIYYASIANSTLPINFVYFKANTTTSGTLLNWQISEYEKGFVFIEKSMDGSNFEEIGKINLESTGNIFEFTDQNLSSIVTYYRLKYKDGDKDIYSDIIVSEPVSTEIDIYPNPCRDNFKIIKKTNPSEEVKIYITNMEGKLIISNSIKIDGYMEFNQINQLKEGIYYLSLYTEDSVFNTIIIKE